jgi:hypothetical protein
MDSEPSQISCKQRREGWTVPGGMRRYSGASTGPGRAGRTGNEPAD